MVGVGLVAFVFNVVAMIFYQRLFWQCVTNTGNFEPIENDICDHNLAELSTIAWFNVLFVFHAPAASIIGALVYSSDSSRFEELRTVMASGGRRLKTFAGSVKRRVKKRLPSSEGRYMGELAAAGVHLNRRKGVSDPWV